MQIESPLWQPDAETLAQANVTAFSSWLAANADTSVDDYASLWRWSVEQPALFWDALRRYYDVPMANVGQVLNELPMPDAEWFPGAELNYVEQVYRHPPSSQPAILCQPEQGALVEISWAELRRQVAALSNTLRRLGVQPGDRVVAYLPNRAETIIAFHAAASVGAVWSVCSPDLGTQGVLDRFSQVTPTVLLAADGYHYGGKDYPRADAVSQILKGLPGVRTCIGVPCLGDERLADVMPDGVEYLHWSQAIAGDAALEVTSVDFSHPLWIVYSSGTTGKPKAIVHSHGGIVLEHLKQMGLQMDIRAGDRFLWYSSTAWMMWNYNIAGLLVGATVCLYDGNPGRPDLYRLWEIVDALGVSQFGAGAAFFESCKNAGLSPRTRLPLTALRAVGSTGSPLLPDVFDWIYRDVDDDIYLSSISGGTDFATACVGGAPVLPVYRGEITCRSLGCAVEAFNEAGQSVVGEVGELVITQPMPSMPVFFWNDPGKKKYRESYFEGFDNVWQHGDWIRITERGSAVIYGRSDATINRQGVRMGTSELYAVVEALPEVEDSLVVDLEYLGRDSYLALFVVPKHGESLTDDLNERIHQGIRTALSPRHVPNGIFEVADVPRTFSGKKMEIPVRKILLGQGDSVSRDTMANPECIDWYLEFAERLRGVEL